MYVCGKLVGGIGNRLFTLAAAFRFANDNSLTCVIDHKFVDHNAHSDTDYTTTVFAKFPTISISDNYIAIKHSPKNPVYYSELPSPISPSTCSWLMDGYFQHELFIKKLYSDFRELLTLPMKEKRPNTCFIHVRRGDYVNNWLHDIDLTAYRQRAIQHIIKNVPIVNFLVVSDDIPWCKKQDMFKDFSFLNHQDEVDTLMEMAACDHAICANSSFSWWGAYLIENPSRVVTFPDKWFTDPSFETQIGFTHSTVIKT